MQRLLITLVILLLGACAGTQQPAEFSLSHQQEHSTVWPALPEIPRFQYLGQLTGESNFKHPQREVGGGRRLLGWLTGLQTDTPETLILRRPQSGMVDAGTQRIYVTDSGLGAVVVFDELAGKLDLWQQADQDESFAAPVAIVRISPDEVLVSDAKLGRIVRLSNTGTPQGSIDAENLLRPAGMAFDAVEDRIYVADSAAHNIKVFSPQGTLVDVLGEPGVEPGQFNTPTHLTLNGEQLIVSDSLNARVQVLTLEGSFVQVIGKRGLYVGNLVRPKGVAADQDGNVYIVESLFDHLLIFDTNGQLLLSIGGSGTAVGQFYLPAGLWIDHRDRIFLADMHNGRVIVLQYLGSS